MAFRTFIAEKDWPWINSLLPIMQVEDTTAIVAINEDTGEQIAACVMDNWTNNSVQAHLLVDHIAALRHGFLEFCTDYIFNFSNRVALYAFVPSDNEKALKLNAHIGCTEAFRLPNGFADGVDYVVLQLLKENCTCLPKPEDR